MEKVDGLEHKFNLLLSRLAEQDNDQPQKQSMPRKRKSDKALVKKSGGRRIHTSDTGTTTPTSDPPDPTFHQNECNPSDGNHRQRQTQDATAALHTTQQTPTTASNEASCMDTTEDNTLEGGIQDDDLSEQMLQEWEDPSPTNSRISISPEVSRKKND